MSRSYGLEVRRQVIELARAGTKVKQLASTFQMCDATIYNWLKQDYLPAARACRRPQADPPVGDRAGGRPESERGVLWTSEAWTLRDKLIGTLMIPGGLTTVLVASVMTASGGASGRGQSSSGDTLSIALFVLVAIAPIITAVYLARRANTGRYRPT